MRLPLEYSSNVYKIKFLTGEDIPDALTLCQENTAYYELIKTSPSEETLRNAMSHVPEGADPEDKFFAGYYQEDQLVALMDLVVRYPLPSNACINWFMVKKDLQKTGIGSRIIEELLFFLMESGIEVVRLDAIEEDPETMRFWTSNGFFPSLMETRTDDNGNHVTELERQIIFRKQL